MSRPSKPVNQWLTKKVSANDAGSMFHEFQPGDGTRYPIISTVLSTVEACEAIGCQSISYLCTLMWDCSMKSIVVAPGDVVHYSYVEEKMGVHGPSAVTIAICLASIIGGQAVSWDEFEAMRARCQKDED